MRDGLLRESKRCYKALIFLIIAGGILFISSCGNQPEMTSTGPSQKENSATSTLPSLLVSDNTSQSDGNMLTWPTFAPPSLISATTIPNPASRMTLPEGVLTWLLLGSDQEPPFFGRTNAIHLLFINPRLAKVSVISIPSDLFVYIPGYSMQRLNAAYALGGISLVRDTLAYNFGIRPDRFVLAHPGDLSWLVDDVGGIEVSVLFPLPEACDVIPAGPQWMDGEKALCYVSYQSGMDEMDRMRRQQQVMRLIFMEMVKNGNLVRLPQLYASYQGWVDTDLDLAELVNFIPLALKLGDPQRISYFMIGWDAVSLWDLPDHTQVQVFLPKQEVINTLFQAALDAVLEPAPLAEVVLTYEAQLTLAVALTQTAMPTATPLPTDTPMPITQTPTPTWQSTPSGQATVTSALYPIETETELSPLYP